MAEEEDVKSEQANSQTSTHRGAERWDGGVNAGEDPVHSLSKDTGPIPLYSERQRGLLSSAVTFISIVLYCV